MFVDASAICAVLLNEPEAPSMLKAMEASKGKLIITPIVRLEAVLSIARQIRIARNAEQNKDEDFDRAAALVQKLLDALDVREMHITESIGSGAIKALKQYGKVTGHPAKLNMGDALAYAAAKAFHAPLLYKGDDFKYTDLA